jgi:hypothetical protein
MQQLKELSGLTYRELEERAAQSGDLLARSTLSDILRRTSVPRPDVLAAFVRACGDGQRVGAWLDARDRIAAQSPALPPAAPVPVAGTEPQPQIAASAGRGSRRTKGRTVMLATGLVVPLLALVIWGLLSAGSDVGASARTPSDGWVTIRPVRSPELCLTDGRDRGGVYDSAVAAQLPCAQAAVPRTYLEPAGEDLYRIQWHHPQEGKGCLTVMSSGPVKGMIEPRNDCGQATLFRVEATAADSEGFRLRPVTSSMCIGISGNGATVGAEATEERCTDATDQRFLIRPS